MLPIALIILVRALCQAVPAAAYSWHLNAAPKQCSDLSITVTGSDGQPPYSVLVVPFGPPPFQNKVDVRGVISQGFAGNSNSLSLPIRYPANTQFVAVVSDSSGFGSGGTSLPTLVGESGDNSCFNASNFWSPHFWFFIGPLTQPAAQVVQCNTTRIWWNNTADVEGTPEFFGVIPGGQSFSILPEGGNITKTTDEGIGFSWLPRIREGTTLIIVAGDGRGQGSGGSAPFTTAHSDDSTCVSAMSPSTTTGAPPGAVEPPRDLGPIIGGAVGGTLGFMVLIAIAVFLFIRHRRLHKVYAYKESSPNPDRPGFLAKSHQATNGLVFEPFPHPAPADSQYPGPRMIQIGSPAYSQNSSNTAAPLHDTSTSHRPPSSHLGSSTPTSTTMITRHVSVIQHVDGGPGEGQPDGATINHLPPQYDTVATAQRDGIRRGFQAGRVKGPRRGSEIRTS